MQTGYVHGYAAPEARRLRDQATTLQALLHGDTRYPAGCTVLEVGCGVGAQTVSLAAHSPGAAITAIDRSAASLAEARERIASAGLSNVRFEEADLLALRFGDASFDHVFLCFVLEHVQDPIAALAALRRVLKPGGTLTVIEGDHGSTVFHPESAAARAAIQCQVDLQRAAGGDALIGRQLQPLLTAAAYAEVRVSPLTVYVDKTRPALNEGFVENTFTAMIAGVRESAVAAGLSTPEAFDAGLRDLRRTTAKDGVFCYTFFQAVGLRPYGPGSTSA